MCTGYQFLEKNSNPVIKTTTVHCVNVMAITKYKSYDHNNYPLLYTWIGRATSHKFEQIFIVLKVIHITCNMGAGDLADLYAQHPRATGLRADGIHIRQIPHVHVTTFECTMCDTDRNFCIMTQSLFIS